MGKINLSRVFLGGMAAGATAVVLEYIAFVAGAYAALTRLTGVNMHEFPASTHIFMAAFQILVGGPLAVWLYAAIRPRFGAGPRTAAIAGTYIWAVLCMYGLTVLAVLGLLPKIPLGVQLMMLVMDLPFLIVCLMVGAKIYQEDGTAASAHSSGA